MAHHIPPQRTGAFTLIELLIVVAIIAILAAIAVPNFLEAQTRSKVSRLRADMRSLATAMESYAVDNNRYPIPSDERGRMITNPITAVNVSPFETRTPLLLTTPIAYMSSLPIDPFNADRTLESPYYHTTTRDYLDIRLRNNPRFNWNIYWFRLFRDMTGKLPPASIQYYISSFGPNRTHDAELPHTGLNLAPHEHNPGALYDPTNGTLSSGDIYYWGPGLGFPN